MAIIYRKTAKGHSEIETRALRLPPRLRSALIVVDGRRSDDELRKLILQQPEETLHTLSEQGFIEIIAITEEDPLPRTQGSAPPPRPNLPVPAAAPAPAPGPATASAAPPFAPPRSFETGRAQAVRSFTDLVGPMAEALAIKMERARTPEELRPLVQTARTIIGNARGGQAAADFAARFLASPGA